MQKEVIACSGSRQGSKIYDKIFHWPSRGVPCLLVTVGIYVTPSVLMIGPDLRSVFTARRLCYGDTVIAGRPQEHETLASLIE